MNDERRALAKAARLHAEGLKLMGLEALPRGGDRGGRSERLAALARAVEQCRKCPLYRTRTHAVVSDGSQDAELMFIGEAPGRDEDLQGKPFVGAAGKLLTKMIEAMGLHREQVYICNILKDRPPNNRTPEPSEVDACLPYLLEQIEIIRPKVICTLGAVAVKALFGPHIAISRVRGSVKEYEGVPLVPTYHPAYLLRNPAAKPQAWEDLQVVLKVLGREPPTKTRTR
ncbi:MAG TPA: uracil-DNA glycosylase [bacterium]